MGNPVDLRSYPTFICERVYCDIPGFPYKVAVGREGGCSFYTKAILIETDEDLGQKQLDDLRRQLEDLLSKQGG